MIFLYIYWCDSIINAWIILKVCRMRVFIYIKETYQDNQLLINFMVYRVLHSLFWFSSLIRKLYWYIFVILCQPWLCFIFLCHSWLLKKTIFVNIFILIESTIFFLLHFYKYCLLIITLFSIMTILNNSPLNPIKTKAIF